MSRKLLAELRELKESSGYDLRTLERKSHASRSSWGRWLSGETWIPLDSAVTLAQVCGGDPRRVELLWELADQGRRAAGAGTPSISPPASAPMPAPMSAQAPSPARTRKESAAGEEWGAGGVAVLVEDVPEGGGAAEEGAVAGYGVPAGSDPETAGAEPAPRRQPRRPRPGALAVVVAVAVVVAGTATWRSVLSPPAGPSRPPAASGVPASQPRTISRSQALTRARSWHPHDADRIPYDQFDTYQGYRTDGSGYASMALQLPKPGPNSLMLAGSAYTFQIPMAQLQPGDLVISPVGDAGTRQVIIFEKWADAGHTSYWAYQQRRGYGTDHLVLRSGLEAHSTYHSYRPKCLEGAAPTARMARADRAATARSPLDR